MAGIRVIAAPVVFTNNTGGGPDELQVPTTGEATRDFDVGSTVEAAWWVPAVPGQLPKRGGWRCRSGLPLAPRSVAGWVPRRASTPPTT